MKPNPLSREQIRNNRPKVRPLARLCLRAQLVGKARSYLEASLARRPSSENSLILADLLEHGGPFDRILVDAPCSGLGALRRNPDARWRVRPEDLPELAKVQRALLESAATLLKPGGVLVYSTCTVTPEYWFNHCASRRSVSWASGASVDLSSEK